MEGGHHVIRITPEAGTQKADHYRDVVLHPHLIEKGFPSWVAAQDGYLFVDQPRHGDIVKTLKSRRNDAAEFARETVKDPNVKLVSGPTTSRSPLPEAKPTELSLRCCENDLRLRMSSGTSSGIFFPRRLPPFLSRCRSVRRERIAHSGCVHIIGLADGRRVAIPWRWGDSREHDLCRVEDHGLDPFSLRVNAYDGPIDFRFLDDGRRWQIEVGKQQQCEQYRADIAEICSQRHLSGRSATCASNDRAVERSRRPLARPGVLPGGNRSKCIRWVETARDPSFAG